MQYSAYSRERDSWHYTACSLTSRRCMTEYLWMNSGSACDWQGHQSTTWKWLCICMTKLKLQWSRSSAAGVTDEFEVGVGLHQGSALSSFLFAIIMDVLTKDIRRVAHWDMLFADDILLCRESRLKLKKALEAWRVALEKAECLLVGRTQDAGELGLQGETVKKVETC